MYTIKRAPNNCTTMGIYFNNNLDFSLTPIDFYHVAETLAKFLNKPLVYNKPKLYKTFLDKTPNGFCKIQPTWGNKFDLLIQESSWHSCSYGNYIKEELEEMFQAMKEYIESAECDMIFSCPSGDIYNIKHNPYSIYKDVYPNTKMTIDIMVYFIVNGLWVYNSKTLKENLDFVHDYFENNDIKNDVNFHYFKAQTKDFTEERYEAAFCLLNNYKVF